MPTPEELSKYRDLAVTSIQHSQKEYDKGVLSLSGGAIAISIAFVDRLIDESTPASTALLLAAWISWSVSIALVLASHLTSQRATSLIIQQLDSGDLSKSPLGGRWQRGTEWLNLASGLSFVVGIILLIAFVTRNL